jgi:hypothetical protein
VASIADDHLKVATKKKYRSVHDRQDPFVQETYLCPEFEQRIPGTGSHEISFDAQ